MAYRKVSAPKPVYGPYGKVKPMSQSHPVVQNNSSVDVTRSPLYLAVKNGTLPASPRT